MKNKEFTKSMLSLTGGLLINLSDVLLFSVYLFGNSFGKSATSRGTYQMFADAHSDFEKFNTRTLLNALYKISSVDKYVQVERDSNSTSISLTKLGKCKLKQKIPFYKTRRNWNDKFYLINFDISEKKRKYRFILRELLRQHSAGKLQNSLWISPYNPSEYLEHVMKYRKIYSDIIITEVDKNAILPYGKEGLHEMIERVYKLSDLNKLYEKFLKKCNKADKLHSAFEYLNILKDDPQLPFELEPKGFFANEAYKKYISLYPHLY